ncbi:2-succinyl-5-enolpyruvyl-6-hydroxy-3-cyclohexene-1-carboxylic-acid synthase [Rothia sp. P4278]|uniref:2-succinyl-5-enolpyruvyl-6-hydroxy-3- cyclohexene-1-carboxylic-acid synthase n=1 Tax=Rothia sp. P4278 TaxID=3402658 RepID=UPI003AEC13DB
MTSAPAPSFITAISVLDTLIRSGMRHVLICPGSRSAPLAYAVGALADAGVLEAHVRIDERSAAFTALGLAKATGQPVGLITTSGTAVGECLPALMEAYHSGLPLALLSADRPAHLQGTGANQTTRQAGLAPAHTRASLTLENYSADPADPQSGDLNRALASLTGRSESNWNLPADQPRGPVQINLAFDTPLTPGPTEQEMLRRWAHSLVPLAQQGVRLLPENPDLSAQSWPRSAQLPEYSYPTVVIAGDGAGPLAQIFAQKLGLPLLAEPSSQARFSPVAVPAYRQLLAGELAGSIERAVIFGHPTLSRPVAALMANSGLERALYAPVPAPWHEPGALDLHLVPTLQGLAEFAGQAPAGWLEGWLEKGKIQEEELHQRVAAYRAGTYRGDLSDSADRTAALSTALDTWEKCLSDDAVLVLGSSNLIRDLDLIAPSAASSPLVFAQRGLAGIDGTLAVAAGISLGLGRKVRVLLGDLTFLHDVGSLNIGPLERKPDVEVLVYDDRGGGIFSTLEHGTLAADSRYTATVQRFFTTPHTANLQALAGAWGDNGFSLRVVTP